MEIRTWRSAIADLRTTLPGAPSGALGEGNPGLVWRCDAAISRFKEKTCLLGRFFSRAAKNIKMLPFPLILPKVFLAMFEQAELQGTQMGPNGPLNAKGTA